MSFVFNLTEITGMCHNQIEKGERQATIDVFKKKKQQLRGSQIKVLIKCMYINLFLFHYKYIKIMRTLSQSISFINVFITF